MHAAWVRGQLRHGTDVTGSGKERDGFVFIPNGGACTRYSMLKLIRSISTRAPCAGGGGIRKGGWPSWLAWAEIERRRFAHGQSSMVTIAAGLGSESAEFSVSFFRVNCQNSIQVPMWPWLQPFSPPLPSLSRRPTPPSPSLSHIFSRSVNGSRVKW